MKALQESKKRMVYFGDDPVRDGKMATDAGMLFGLFKESSSQSDLNHGGRFIFSDWKIIANFLESKKALFDGRSIKEIMDHQTFGIEGIPAVSGRERR